MANPDIIESPAFLTSARGMTLCNKLSISSHAGNEYVCSSFRKELRVSISLLQGAGNANGNGNTGAASFISRILLWDRDAVLGLQVQCL